MLVTTGRLLLLGYVCTYNKDIKQLHVWMKCMMLKQDDGLSQVVLAHE